MWRGIRRENGIFPAKRLGRKVIIPLQSIENQHHVIEAHQAEK